MGAGRPRKHHDGYEVKPVVVPKEAEHIWDKAKELADREGNTSVSEIVNKALAQYVGEHYPGNPQVPLEAAKSVAIMQEYITKRAISRLTGIFQTNWCSPGARRSAKDRAMALALKVKNPPAELLALMEKAVNED